MSFTVMLVASRTNRKT